MGSNPSPITGLAERLTRPIIGIENRTAQEAFDIMADRIRSALSLPQPTIDREAIARAAYKADFLHRMKDVPATFDFDWAWNECASMPLSGPGFVGQWYAIADAMIAALLHPIDDISEDKP